MKRELRQGCGTSPSLFDTFIDEFLRGKSNV